MMIFFFYFSGIEKKMKKEKMAVGLLFPGADAFLSCVLVAEEIRGLPLMAVMCGAHHERENARQ